MQIAETGHLAAGIAPSTGNILSIISENADCIDVGGGGGCEKKSMGVKWASHYYKYYCSICNGDQLHDFSVPELVRSQSTNQRLALTR